MYARFSLIDHNGLIYRNKAAIMSSVRKTEVYEFNDANISKIFEADAPEFVRSAVWTSDDELKVVGWNHFTASYSLSQKN